jgi:molybdate transport system ATP-binding protein
MTSLRADICHAFDRISLDVTLDLAGGLTALLGPSGAGKTSVLNVLAGLLRPDAARIMIDDETVADTARGIWMPPHLRRIGYVFQDSRLFSHLTVRQNLAFGGWFARDRGEGIGLDEVIGLLELRPLLHRHPAKLSGGEQRRVALGRALLSHPRLLLLDEPLGSLDVARRREILPYLDRLIAELRLPMIYVTHDWAEIHGRAQQVVLMDHGSSRLSSSAAAASTSQTTSPSSG